MWDGSARYIFRATGGRNVGFGGEHTLIMGFTVEQKIEILADPGLLTEQQAKAYVYREIESISRGHAAEHMDCSKSAVDDRLTEAIEKIEAAETTVYALGEIKSAGGTENSH